jgi:membrane protein implicated in regulation of membrane protease activity
MRDTSIVAAAVAAAEMLGAGDPATDLPDGAAGVAGALPSGDLWSAAAGVTLLACALAALLLVVDGGL